MASEAEHKTITHTYAPFSIEHFSRVEETSDEERSQYKGSCHCGAIAFQVTLKCPFPKYPVNSCTCSICTHNGYLLVYPMRQDVKFLGDSEGKMGAYRFGDKKKDHKFCKDCGSSIMIDFNRPTATGETDPRKDMVAINSKEARALKLSYTLKTALQRANNPARTHIKGPCAEKLGLKLTPISDIDAPGPFLTTSMRGVFAAGDSVTPYKVVNGELKIWDIKLSFEAWI